MSTSDGLLQRRRLKMDGSPESVPFYPHEFVQRQSSIGVTDTSALVLENLASEDLDPIRCIRIRNAIKNYGGDQSLPPLADDELDGDLGLTTTVEGPLLLGNDMQLRQHLSPHGLAFQVLHGADVLINEF
ncbi:hypothetical protein [Vreelandella arcis]|uniref:hypothetical protein n=1 Tax=Vreelandella arcis TaxID=416873 RepID=UPI001B8D064A|nr:hypothetical protein [Halomonas arcis]